MWAVFPPGASGMGSPRTHHSLMCAFASSSENKVPKFNDLLQRTPSARCTRHVTLQHKGPRAKTKGPPSTHGSPRHGSPQGRLACAASAAAGAGTSCGGGCTPCGCAGGGGDGCAPGCGSATSGCGCNGGSGCAGARAGGCGAPCPHLRRFLRGAPAASA